MEGQRQYYRGGYCGERKMMRNRCDLDYEQSTDLAVVDIMDKLRKSQLANGGYSCQQGNSGNAYESVEIYMKRTQQIPGHDQYACSKYQQNNVKMEYDEEKEMLFVSRMMSHEKLRYEKWINELPNKKEFMVNILQEMKKRGVQNIYDEETFIRIVFEKKAEIVGKSSSHGSNQSLVISKDKVSCSSQQSSTAHVSEYGAAASNGVINSADRLSDTELSFVKDMMSCEEIKEFSINEESMLEIIREMKKQGIKNLCNKESFVRFVSEKMSKMQGFSNDNSYSIAKVSNGCGGFDGYNDQVVACAEFSSSEVSFVKRMMVSEKINWIRELSSHKDREAFLYSIIRQMKREGIKNVCNEECFIKRIHQEIKRIYQQEKHKQMQRNNGGGYQIIREEIITKHDNNGNYQRMNEYRASGHGGDFDGNMGAEFYDGNFHGQALRIQQQQKKKIVGRPKYYNSRAGASGSSNLCGGAAEWYTNGRYF